MRYEEMVGNKPELDRRSSPYRIQVLDRAVVVLDALAKNQQRGLTLVEMAQAIGVAKGTAHRLLMVLEQWRFVFRQPVNDRYCRRERGRAVPSNDGRACRTSGETGGRDGKGPERGTRRQSFHDSASE